MWRLTLNLAGLDRLSRRAASLSGTRRVALTEFFTPAFMRRHSRFGTFQALIEASPFAGQDFQAIPDDAWDAFVRQVTGFRSWQAMLNEAAADWTLSRLLDSR